MFRVFSRLVSMPLTIATRAASSFINTSRTANSNIVRSHRRVLWAATRSHILPTPNIRSMSTAAAGFVHNCRTEDDVARPPLPFPTIAYGPAKDDHVTKKLEAKAQQLVSALGSYELYVSTKGDAVTADDHKAGIKSMLDLAEHRANYGKHDEAKELSERALALAKKVDDPALMFKANHAIATELHNFGQYHRALEIWRQQMQRALPGTEVYADTQRNMSATLLMLAQFDESLDNMDAAEQFYRDTYGPDSPQVMFCYDIMALNLWSIAESQLCSNPDDKIRMRERADRLMSASNQLRRSHQNTNWEQYLVSLRNRAMVRMRINTHDSLFEAEIDWREQRNTLTRELGATHKRTLFAVICWGDAVTFEDTAMKVYVQALDNLDKAKTDLAANGFSSVQEWEALKARCEASKSQLAAGKKAGERGGPWFPPEVMTLTMRPDVCVY